MRVDEWKEAKSGRESVCEKGREIGMGEKKVKKRKSK